MAAALTGLGARIDEDGADWVVTPGAAARVRRAIQCGLAGTVMRFLPAVAALADGPVRFDGDDVARWPGRWVRCSTALRTLGVRVEEHGEPGHLPFTVHGRGSVRGGQVDVDASASSQFVSGLLLAAARFEQGLTLRHTGRTLPSLPHIEMTVALLREAGVEVDDSRPAIWQVAPGPIAGRDVRVEPDLSNAAPFLCAALVAGGTVRVPGWPTSTTQPGRPAARDPRAHGRHDAPGRRRAERDRDRRDPRRRPRPARRRARSRRRSPRSPPWPTPPPGCAASPTCAATRPTGSPRSRPRSRGSAGRRSRRRTGSSSRRDR